MAPKVDITADQINCLIYAYLEDSGFQHSSYTLRSESRLDLSPYAKTPIRRGELVDLLAKALLYTEAEAHWKQGPNATDCSAPFSLIVPHICDMQPSAHHESSASPLTAQPRPELFPPQTNGLSQDADPFITDRKRKAETEDVIDTRTDKRTRAEDIEMQLEENPESVPFSTLSSTNQSTIIPSEYIDHDFIDSGNEINGTIVVDPPVSATSPLRDPVIFCEGHSGLVFPLAWNPAHFNMLASGSDDGTLRIWSWNDVKEFLQSPEPQNLNSQSSQPSAIILHHQPGPGLGQITSIDWNMDGSLMATGSSDCLLQVWRKTGEPYMTQRSHRDMVLSVRFSSGGRWLLSASCDGTACVWNVASKQLQMEVKMSIGCHDVDWLNENTFAACSTNASIHLVSLSLNQVFRTLIGHSKEVNQVKFNKQGTMLASCSDDHTARIWFKEAWTDINGFIATGGNELNESPMPLKYPAKFTLFGHTKRVIDIQWCPCRDGTAEKLLATYCGDATARIWDASCGSCLHIFSDGTKLVASITFSLDGYFLATGCEDGCLYIYNTQTGCEIWRWQVKEPGGGSIIDINWQKIGGSHLAFSMGTGVIGIVDTTKVQELAFTPSPPAPSV